jgi:short-subunit dehydrogenase
VALGSARIALGRDDGAENGRHQTKLRKLKDAFKGKTALVTGGASGFGAEIVRSYVREGAKVIILDLNVAGAKAVATVVRLRWGGRHQTCFD